MFSRFIQRNNKNDHRGNKDSKLNSVTGLPILSSMQTKSEIDQAISELSKLNSSDLEIQRKFQKNNPDLEKSIQDLIQDLKLEDDAIQRQVQNDLDENESTVKTPFAIQRTVANKNRARANEDAELYLQEQQRESRIKEIWNDQKFNQHNNFSKAYSVPNTEAFLNSIAEKLLDADVKSAGVMLLGILRENCNEDEAIDEKFECLLRERGEKLHSTYLKLFQVFVDLGGVAGGFFIAPINNVVSGGGNNFNSNNIGSSNMTSSNNNTTEQSNEERMFKNAIIRVQSNLRFGDPELIGSIIECQEITEKLILPQIWTNLLEKESAILLYGPPGTGKTQIAKGIRNLFNDELPENAFVELFSATGASLKGKYVGQSEKQITWIYDEIQKRAVQSNKDPAISILFLDEVEALAQSRTKSNDSSSASIVTTFLQLLDGVSKKYNNVITVAATNLPWQLDSAIYRRFTTKIFVDLPGDKDRFKIIKQTMVKRLVHMSKFGKKLNKKRNDLQSMTENEDKLLKIEEENYIKAKLALNNADWLNNFTWRLTFATGYQEQVAEEFLTAAFENQGMEPAESSTSVNEFIRERDHVNPQSIYLETDISVQKMGERDRNFRSTDQDFNYQYEQVLRIIQNDEIKLNEDEKEDLFERKKELQSELQVAEKFEKKFAEENKAAEAKRRKEEDTVPGGGVNSGAEPETNEDKTEGTEKTPSRSVTDIKEQLEYLKKNSKVRLSTPKYLFGTTTAELVLLVNQILNSFAIKTLKKRRTLDNCNPYCPTCKDMPQKCIKCKGIQKNEAVLDLELFRSVIQPISGNQISKEVPSEAFVRTALETLTKNKSATNASEYADMVFFSVTGQVPK